MTADVSKMPWITPKARALLERVDLVSPLGIPRELYREAFELERHGLAKCHVERRYNKKPRWLLTLRRTEDE